MDKEENKFTVNVDKALDSFVSEVKDLYGDHLMRVVLYGSYARGDFREDSDIDVMVLVDLDDDGVEKTSGDVYDIAYDVDYDNDTMIMPIVKNIDFFYKWVNAYPFYNNVANEGVNLYERKAG